MMRPIVTAIFVWFLIVAVAALVAVPPSAAGWIETVKSLGVASAAAAGVVAPFLTIAMARHQQELARETALYQQNLTERLESLKTEYAREVEVLKRSLSENLEVRKAEIAGQVEAFDETLRAAHFLYFVVRERANGSIEDGDALFAEADRKAAEASAIVWHLPEADQATWHQIYGRAKHLAVLLRTSPRDTSDTALRGYASELGAFIAQLQKAGEQVFAEARTLKVGLPSPGTESAAASHATTH